MTRGGRLSQAVGASFESFLESQHDAALRLGVLAWVHHTQAVTKMVNGRLKYIAKGAADYSGVLVDARAVAVEAKTTQGERLARSEIDVLQAKHLSAVAAVGGIALLAVEFRTKTKIPTVAAHQRYAIPWLDVPWRVIRTAESLSLEDCKEEWCINFSECYLGRHVPTEKRRVVGAPKRVYHRE